MTEKRWITTLTGALGESELKHEEGSINAQVDTDLDRFKGLPYLPGVLDQIRGHLRYGWGEGFTVEEDATKPWIVHVFFDGDVGSLRYRHA